MPFTPSHAVVALPFVRTPLVPAAIAVGAMTPDLPLFLRGTPLTYQATHTNVLLSSVLALGLLALWYLLLRPAVRELSPHPLSRRLHAGWDATGLDAARAAAWRHAGRGSTSVWLAIGLVVLSLVVGVLSHIAWDAFTHEGRFGVRLIPALADAWGPLPGYKWVQHVSSVAGLAILAVYGARWLAKRTSAVSVDRVLPSWVRRAWWLALPVVLVAAWAIGLVVYGPLTASWTAQHLAYRVLPPACAVWGALTVALCVVVVALRIRRRAAR